MLVEIIFLIIFNDINEIIPFGLQIALNKLHKKIGTLSINRFFFKINQCF